MKVEHIVYKGKKITILDWTECKTQEDGIQMLNDVVPIYQNATEKLLTLDIWTGKSGSIQFMKEAKRLGKEVYSKHREKGAAIGLTGIKRVLLTAYNSYSGDDVAMFDTKEQALDYLAS